MKKRYVYILLTVPLLLQSCFIGVNLFDVALRAHNTFEEKRAVKRFVDQFDTTNFNLFKGKYITSFIRGVDVPDSLKINNIIEYVIDLNIKSPAFYIILFDAERDSVLKVIKDRKDATALVDLTEIQNLLREFRKLDIVRLEVDFAGNAYIYPQYYYAPIVLKRADSSAPIKSTNFEHYKGNWYVRYKVKSINHP